MTFQQLRTSFVFKGLCLLTGLQFLVDLTFPTWTMALTSGPSTPEVQSFEPMGTTDMVDLFSGDFMYNIPLLELPGPNGGYPFNLAYHSGVGMDQEASWVGLGWNLNPGVINRGMRGLPDDFNGDVIEKTLDMKPATTIGVTIGGGIEGFGADKDLTEGKTPPDKERHFTGGLSMRLYHNSYKGIGYSLNPFFGKGNPDGGIGFNVSFSLDPQEGVGGNAGLSMGSIIKGNEQNTMVKSNIGIGYNSNRGLSASVGGSISGHNDYVGSDNSRQPAPKKAYEAIGGTSSYSFASPSFTPSVTMPMTNESLDFKLKMGFALFGVYGNFSISGFWSEQRLTNPGSAQSFHAYGYHHLGKASSAAKEKRMMDFNRDKDGIIRNESPNLPIPQMTFDYYNVMGQGVGGMYRAYRSDIGILHDPYARSITSGGAIGGDAGIPAHGGVDGTYSGGESWSGMWTDDNPWESHFVFNDGQQYIDGGAGIDYENVYYRSHGEYTSVDSNELAYIGGFKAVRAEINSSHQPALDKYMHFSETVVGSTLQNKRSAATYGRAPRNNSIQPLTVSQMGGDDNIQMGEYKVKLYNSSSEIDRSTNEDHIGGITAINPDGLRYVYGLPAYNTESNEYVYSVDGEIINDDCVGRISQGASSYKSKDYTEQYYSKTKIPAYVYAYHLTSLLGTDYVDVTNDGPSDDDYGYWVKFTYEQKDDDFGWRAPFKDATYIEGYESEISDDKASYAFGKREQYLVRVAETRTHKVEFFTSTRNDARGTVDGGGTLSAYSHKLDSIKLFSKADLSTPIKTVHFRYDYSLCDDVDNNGSDEGKLTLTQLWFTYQNSSRGSLSPYKFHYGQYDHNLTSPVEGNADYDETNIDRWGQFANRGNRCLKRDWPYTEQYESQSYMDSLAGMWNMTDIELPTGGKIEVDYESDDYAYVQHVPAHQMFAIDSVHGMNSTTSTDWKVYFELENPVPVSGGAEEIREQYLNGLRRGNDYHLYFKIRSNLRDSIYEYVSGYAKLDMASGRYGGDASSIQTINEISQYTKAFVTLKAVDINGPVNYHPIRVAAWQFMRTNMPDLLVMSGTLDAPPGSSAAKAQKMAAGRKLATITNHIHKMFKGYRTHAKERGYARYIDNAFSMIRLCTPDGIKYGGGCRVKQLTIKDQWDAVTTESGHEYGQVYSYTQLNNDGDEISSGVASYEPMIGGDEIALRYPKNYAQSIPFMTDNYQFFEYPVNEAYFPGPSVGYAKVEVKSLATADVLASPSQDTRTTGVTVHEFYTARDYPVITDETDLDKGAHKDRWIPIPLIGQVQETYYTGAQGYSITLNDMHGKPKKVANYGLDKDNVLVPDPVSSVMYEYFDEPVVMRDGSGLLVRRPENHLPVMTPDSTNGRYGLGPITNKLVGVEYEIFHDMRQSYDESNHSGVAFNFEVMLPILTIPAPWPNFVRTQTEYKSVVTNKVIHRAGILKSTIATDGLSTVKTENKVFDYRTGRALLTSTQNNFNDDIYTHSIPVHFQYSGMDAAYQNFLFRFKAQVADADDDGVYQLDSITTAGGMVISDENFYRMIHPGDVLVVDTVEGLSLDPFAATMTNTYALDTAYVFQMHTSAVLDTGDVIRAHVVRSGHRNQLMTDAGQVVALDVDPTNSSNYGDANYSIHEIDAISQDFVDFLNNEVLDCNGYLPLNSQFYLDDPAYYNDKGEHKYPDAWKVWKEIKNILPSEGRNKPLGFYEGLCLECEDLYTTGTAEQREEGYSIVLTYRGGGETHIPCFAKRKKVDPSFPTDPTKSIDILIDHFVKGPAANEVTTVYITGESNTTQCVPGKYDCGTLNPPTGLCWWDPVGQDTTDRLVKYTSNVIQASAVEFCDYWDFDYGFEKCETEDSEPNRYAIGEKGIWRVKKTHYYQDKRKKTGDAVDLSADGVYVNDPANTDRFYFFNWDTEFSRPQHHRWLPQETVTRYNPSGQLVEQKDVLDIYSAGRFGFSGDIPVMSVGNADYFSIYFSGGDDPNEDLYGSKSSTDEAHSGKRSLKYSLSAGVAQEMDTCIRTHAGTEYFISLWMAVPSESSFTLAGEGLGIRARFLDRDKTAVNSSVLLYPDGPIVEGWQRVTGTVTAGGSDYAGGYMILDVESDVSKTVYLDDIRVMPDQAVAKTFVYNPDNYRLHAELDDNNFATFYHYDEEGQLYLLKKETERGVMTIQENRRHTAE